MREDIPALQKVLDGTELFPSEMLPDMMNGDGDIWLTAELDGRTLGFCYAAPEALTEATWNMVAIAVLPSAQGIGVGGALTAELEAELQRRSQATLIVDTSGTEAFAQTRAFYAKRGYIEEARIRDFWAPGDDKVIFWKSLV